MTTEPTRKKILIVDDAKENIDLLRGVLGDYLLVATLSGRQALTLASSDKPPDLILLDIRMPDMDGCEVCRRLKADARTADIPIIFLTAMATVEDEARGLALGAVDYITKPISPPVVLARVATHLAMRDAYRQLERQNAELQELERLRKDVDAIVRHDLKSPIDGIIGAADFLLGAKEISQEQLKEFLKLMRDSARQAMAMIQLSLDLIKIEQGTYAVTLDSINLLSIIRRIRAESQGWMRGKQVEIKVFIQGHPWQEQESFMVHGDSTLCYTMLANLCKNAIEASKHMGVVQISLSRNGRASIAIHNAGVVPQEIRDNFFKKYATFGKQGGMGLGTYSARLMAEAQNG
ncbi:MAG: response regulator, partial [Magnetococcales bacterium]|nr:response regulator [Magnetococcales bacterium]